MSNEPTVGGRSEEEQQAAEVFNAQQADEKQSEKSHFRSTEEIAHELAQSYEPKLLSVNIEETITHILEYVKAGRNIRNFCHHLSSQERKPILEINNARTAAMLQNGFEHWLANFETEELANAFVTELENSNEYQELRSQLQAKIEELKAVLDNDLRPLCSSVDKLDSYLAMPDPSANLLLEMASSKAFVREKRTGDVFDLQRGYNLPPQYKQMLESVLDQIDAILLDIDHIKDGQRRIIFQNAKQWLDTNRIKSFVYPINHFKISGSGLPVAEKVYGKAKLADTISEPETLTIFVDVHKTYSPEGHAGIPRGGTNNLGDLSGVLDESKVIYESLEYPSSENAAGKSAEVQKRLLRTIQERPDIRTLNLQVLFPSQRRNDSSLTREEQQRLRDNSIGRAIPSEGSELFLFDPTHIMSSQYEDEKHGLSEARRLVEDLRKNPEWIAKLKNKIPLEPNYTYNGPELA